jgi:hypothetical protein
MKFVTTERKEQVKEKWGGEGRTEEGRYGNSVSGNLIHIHQPATPST